MEIKKLGKTDLDISRIGFGALSIAGFHYGKTDDNESKLAIKRALELGINFFDTADVYGFGKSESILAEGLGSERDKVIIATKGGVRWDEGNKKSYYDLSPEYISAAVENSLANLKIKTIPLYQMHYPDLNVLAGDTMEVLNKLKDKGKIKHIGCSNFTAEQVREYSKYGRIESIQVPYNILNQEIAEKVFDVCRELNIGIIAYSPIAQGFLSGKFKKDEVFSENDRRRDSKYFKNDVFEKAEQLFKMMEEIAEKYGKNMAQVAIRWILDNRDITGIIVGAKTAKEVEEAVGTTGWNLSENEYSQLSSLGKEVLLD